MHNVLVIGAVNSTKETIKGLLRNGIEPKGILGYVPHDVTNVSGWADLGNLAEEYNIPFKSFRKINEVEHLDWAKGKKPDIIFAVGFSQLLKKEWLEMPTLGCVGFHPTKLPRGRGRAPIAWLKLNENEGASTFFLMGEGADDGPIFVQKPFSVEKKDDATSIETKILHTLSDALDEWLPKLKNGEWNPIPQSEAQASWYGKRTPKDGLIEWDNSANYIDRLIKATTKPHPGAYSFFKKEKIVIWKSEVEKELNIKGVTGRILKKDSTKGLLVQCGKGLIWLKKLSKDFSEFSVGQRLGYILQVEIDKIWHEINKIKDG